MWSAKFLILILISTIITFFSGQLISKYRDKRKLFLALSLIINLGILFYFKYFNFFTDSIINLCQYLSIEWNPKRFEILLPVGISFYTFQALSYTIDVYRGHIKPESHFGKYALFVSFFPQLVAGPIEKSKNLLPQFSVEHKFDYDRIKEGLILMLWGFFKKIVIADRLAILVNTVYNSPENYEGVPLLVATLFFAFQIYCDFSSYTDIAIGAAKVMGFKAT
jgi:D-alanyl-lipoteichoic acid acyltransferase DltB (MBOAT superfamily)